MRKAKSESRGCLSARGTTVKEAKDRLNAKIDAALEGDYTPVFLSYKGENAIVYREPQGWSYSLVNPNVDGQAKVRVTQPCKTRQDALDSAGAHIIQNGCDINAIHSVDDFPEWFTSPYYRSELVAWCRWQRAAVHAKLQGEPDVHGWACDNCRNEQFA